MTVDARPALDRYRLLGRSGLRVSPLCLGTMTFGTEWSWGSEKEQCRCILDRYAERGGNFLDTANYYTGGSSESFLGEFLEGRRERFVLATKYSLGMRQGDPNSGGNHRKNLVQSLDASLRRLKTDYIDLYWVHAWDGTTPIDEVLRALDDAVRQGKILYTGFSDVPAWKAAQANTIAALRGWTSFTALQVQYNLIDRTAERDLIPMALELGMGVMPWSPLAGGILTGKYARAASGGEAPDSGRYESLKAKATGKAAEIAGVVMQVAEECGRTPSQIALSWLLGRPGVACPILGARTLAQLDDNLGCLEFALDEGQRARLETVSAIEPGFPHGFLANDAFRYRVSAGTRIDGLTA